MEMSGGIEVRITGATPLEVLARIAAWGLRCSSEPSVHRLAKQLMELENNLNAYDKDGNPAPSASPVATPANPSGPAAGETGPTAVPSENAAPVQEPKPEPESVPAPTPTASKAPSLENIRAKGIEAAKKHGQPAIKAILKELGAENMTALPEDKRTEFLAKLEGLGEGNA